ncbi:MAG: DNA polymerase IV [Candidatus Omnitrophica bacterium]|nr:DNA polymerase IV [Candidatus Omnitrophota bacterium]
MENTIFHIDMDAYFASIEQLTNPFLKGKPVAVSGGPSTKSVVASCSYEAKKYGVKSGMSIHQAFFLCPNLVVVPGNPEKYIETSKKIFEIIKSFKEKIEIYSIDEVFINVSEIYRLYGSKEDLAREIKNKIEKDTGLTCSIGGGSNRLIAKICSSISKPSGIKILEKEEIEEFMKELPITEIPGIGNKIYEKLSNFGIEKCGDVKKIGKEFFLRIFGKYGEKIYNYACGIEQPEILTEILEKSIGHSYTLPFDTDDSGIISKTLFNLSEKVAQRMREKRKHGSFISLFLRFEDFTSILKRKKFRDISADGSLIFNLCLEIISSLKIEKKIRTIGISVGGLFDYDYQYVFEERIKREIVFYYVDKINEKFGEETVIPAILLNTQKIRKSHSFYLYKIKESKTKTQE